ncbi:MAG TPA: hypothetical protein VNU68_32510 [Verrucomicrobiae bacterium]|nr:hypothetical protein [Verrucomicrobiae bacterium]
MGILLRIGGGFAARGKMSACRSGGAELPQVTFKFADPPASVYDLA